MSTSYEEFCGQIQHRIQADTQAEAVRTIRSVLETLGERVDDGGATDIASPLPMEIDRYLLQVEHGHTYDYDEFVDRVVDRLNYDDIDLEASYGKPGEIDRAEAVFRIQAVVALLSDLVPGGKIANVEHQFPDEFEDMFAFVDADSPPWDARD